MSNYGNEPPQNPYGENPPPPPPPPPAGGGYGAPPPAYGAPGAYGAAPGTPTAGYGAQGYGGPGYAAAPAYDYAHWGKRVGASLIDGLLTMLAAIPLIVGYVILVSNAVSNTEFDSTTGTYTTTGDTATSPAAVVLILIGFVTYIAFFIWNTCIKQGSTGYSIGKGVMGIKLVNEATGQPVGGGMSFVRQLVHILDGFCYIGYLWPLWDAKKQTFADKIMSTVVYNAPKA